ncbi:hypothetical protein Tco_0172756 [Tanacetum coccineum]
MERGTVLDKLPLKQKKIRRSVSMIDESLNLSHLFYADDAIFVGKWNSSNLSTVVNVLKWFYLALGLKINLNKIRKLASKGIDLLSLVKKKVGNGEATSFWNVVWLGDFPLKQTYPRLYFLELDKHVSVTSKLRANSLISSFRRSPQSGIEEEQLLLLISNTSFVILPNII